MSVRTVESVIEPGTPHFVGDGFRVNNFIPGGVSMQRMDPFIMMDYNTPHHFNATETPRGVGVHPHRGFETVTIAYKGKIEHHDSGGGGGIIAEGDVQWMTAGSGVLHKEFHEKEWSKNGGDFQMVQLWVNLPASKKMTKPAYQSLLNSQINKFALHQDGSLVEVIAGEYKNVKGAASTFTPMHVFNVRLKKHKEALFQFPVHFNTALLVIDGSIMVNNTKAVPAHHFTQMANDGGDFSITSTEDAVVLILSGEPINEPIAAHGPFVMNTRQELMQAFHDFNEGKFGFLE
jgi:redox-sensitive bicupin YhaK (pirin superfamily)